MEDLEIKVGEEVVESIDDVKIGEDYQVVVINDDKIKSRGVEFKVIDIRGSYLDVRVISSGWTSKYNINDYIGESAEKSLIKTS